jgi:hypothetical protein
MLTTPKMPTTPTMLTMLLLPTTLDIHSNNDTSGFHVPSALVNVTYIPTLSDAAYNVISCEFDQK